MRHLLVLFFVTVVATFSLAQVQVAFPGGFVNVPSRGNPAYAQPQGVQAPNQYQYTQYNQPAGGVQVAYPGGSVNVPSRGGSFGRPGFVSFPGGSVQFGR